MAWKGGLAVYITNYRATGNVSVEIHVSHIGGSQSLKVPKGDRRLRTTPLQFIAALLPGPGVSVVSYPINTVELESNTPKCDQ